MIKKKDEKRMEMGETERKLENKKKYLKKKKRGREEREKK